MVESCKEVEPFPQWFAEYRRLDGGHTEEEFAKNLDMFFEITMNIYVSGDPQKPDGTFWESREEAYEYWVRKISSPVEAARYFDAVDTVTAYT